MTEHQAIRDFCLPALNLRRDRFQSRREVILRSGVEYDMGAKLKDLFSLKSTQKAFLIFVDSRNICQCLWIWEFCNRDYEKLCEIALSSSLDTYCVNQRKVGRFELTDEGADHQEVIQ